MKFFDWLKTNGLINVNVNFPNLKNVKILSDISIKSPINIKKNSDNAQLDIRINPQKLTDPESVERVRKMLRAAVAEGGELIETSTQGLISEVGQFQNDPENIILREKLSKVIPHRDAAIWEAALFIRRQHREGHSVSELKTDIRLRYGDKGKNIANLCSTGYLEEIIIPIYDELSSKPDFVYSEFKSQYDVIVTKYPFAVFISRTETSDDAMKEIKEKIEYNKTYGVPSLNIHAISQENIEKITDILNKDDIKALFSKPPDIKIDGDVYLATVYF